MRDNFPRYKQGETEAIKKKLFAKNKKILNDFLRFCGTTAGEGKLQKIERHMIQLYDVTGVDFDKLNKDVLTDFLILLKQSDKSVWTKNEIKAYLKKFIRWYYKDLEMTELITLEKSRVAHKITEGDLLTSHEVEKMIRVAEKYWEKAYLLLAYETGARPQELVDLKWSDVTFDDEYAVVKLYSKKTKAYRDFPVYKTMKPLWDWKENYSFPERTKQDYVFPARLHRNQPITTATVNKMFRRLAKRAGISKDVWSYLIRHGRATELYDKLPTKAVEKLMGHTDMYKTYSHISTKKARKMMLEKIYQVNDLSEKRDEFDKRLEALEKLYEREVNDRKKLEKKLSLYEKTQQPLMVKMRAKMKGT